MAVSTPVHENPNEGCDCTGIFDVNLRTETIRYPTAGSRIASRVIVCFEPLWYVLRPYIAPDLFEGHPVNNNSSPHRLRQRVDPLETRLLQRVGGWLDLGIPSAPSDASNLSNLVDTPSKVDVNDLPNRP